MYGFQVVLNCIMDIHRNVFMWGQQEQIKKEKLNLTIQLPRKRSVSGMPSYNDTLKKKQREKLQEIRNDLCCLQEFVMVLVLVVLGTISEWCRSIKTLSDQ